MTEDRGAHQVLCSGASIGDNESRSKLTLDYRADKKPNVRIGLPGFVDQMLHVPDRLLDLLELAAYVYCADRWTDRGPKDAVEYHAWSRSFAFRQRVRDIEFWSQADVKNKLNAALSFLSGDREFAFDFEPGHETPPAGLFDFKGVSLPSKRDSHVVLFSGGLDSLTGVYDLLSNTSDDVWLVSHRSSQPQTGHTQDRLVKTLNQRFPGRIHHYKFHCNLVGHRAVEETQRTRMFLYSTIAFVISTTYGRNRISIFENGVTSLNFPRREDLLNARATRTTHPKTIALLQDLFRRIGSEELNISTPFFWHTKTDVVAQLAASEGKNLIPSSVSCSRTFLPIGSASHCGHCSQCVDRRFACYGAGVAEIDDAVPYATNFITDAVAAGEARTTLVDFVRQANHFSTSNTDHFASELIGPLAEVIDFVGAEDEESAISAIAELCQRHGHQAMNALHLMRSKHDKLNAPVTPGSLISLVGDREYLKPPVMQLVEAVNRRLAIAVPLAFQHTAPEDERRVNDAISAILHSDRERFQREHPAVRFGLATTVPDHASFDGDLVIETKYIRGSTSPSRASEGIAADLTKYPEHVHILFVVYDPQRAIPDDQTFCDAFERKGRCTVHVIR
jgi:7-cyano-7-deazaguanine synthase in queuosine biosynthesis